MAALRRGWVGFWGCSWESCSGSAHVHVCMRVHGGVCVCVLGLVVGFEGETGDLKTFSVKRERENKTAFKKQ